jgi:predicted ArsR family transcriptional regulator
MEQAAGRVDAMAQLSEKAQIRVKTIRKLINGVRKTEQRTIEYLKAYQSAGDIPMTKLSNGKTTKSFELIKIDTNNVANMEIKELELELTQIAKEGGIDVKELLERKMQDVGQAVGETVGKAANGPWQAIKRLGGAVKQGANQKIMTTRELLIR